MDNLKELKPKKSGESDKYSWQLCQYIERNYPSKMPNVYAMLTRSKWDEESDGVNETNIEFNCNNIQPYYIWIGHKEDDNWYYGNRLSTIMGCSRDKYTSFANPWLHKQKVEDVTEWFWREYINRGRCIWDSKHGGHFNGDEYRFTYNADKTERQCSWCGLQQKLYTITQTVQVDEHKWLNV